MQLAVDYTATHPDFYAPLDDHRHLGEILKPTRVPEPWIGDEHGIWTYWHRSDRDDLAEDGWKVHVSARHDRLAPVLDRVAAVCFAQGVQFKHLTTDRLYWSTHQKYAHRGQAGKFIAAYPADVEAARRLMETLRVELREEEGPYILTDRRYKDARTVFYRYGAYIPRLRPGADGRWTAFTRDVRGELVPDVRGVSFHLPPGIEDPFAPGGTRRDPGEGRGVKALNGFTLESSVRFTNAGGTYRGREIATGRRVFVKEARAHTGLRDDNATATEQLREEWETLTALHTIAPGLAPEPISYFRAWEHEFLVCEHVEGVLLGQWVARNHPLLMAGSTKADFAAYYERAESIIAGLDAIFDRLHAAGYLFVDVSPGNVVLTGDTSVRLVDFGSAHRLGDPTFLRAGTPGYAPPEGLVGDDLATYDHFGLAALAQHLLAPLHGTVERNPAVMSHLHGELADLAPVPPALWRRATRFVPAEPPAPWPTPEEVAADPLGQLSTLRDAVADALVAMTDLTGRSRIYPTVPQGHETNTLCAAYGTAGVIHALGRTGRALPDGLLERFRRDTLAQRDHLGPGLYVGTAGIAWVLADNGLLEEASDLLAAADHHPLTTESASLFGGAAGVALAHLAQYGHTGDEQHLERATEIADGLPANELQPELLGRDDAVGLAHGRAGVALMLQQLAGVTGDDKYLRRAIQLLHAELDRVTDPDAAGLLFPVSARDDRAMPYLFAGSAGIAFAAGRCLQHLPDERLAHALPRVLAPLHLPFTVLPGLWSGLAGLAFTLSDHALLTGAWSEGGANRAAAVRRACSLFKYGVPHATGVRFLGDFLLRYSAELWSGSAGILLALDHVLDPRPDALFTVDALVAERRR